MYVVFNLTTFYHLYKIYWRRLVEWFLMVWKEVAMTGCNALPQICLKGFRKITKIRRPNDCSWDILIMKYEYSLTEKRTQFFQSVACGTTFHLTGILYTSNKTIMGETTLRAMIRTQGPFSRDPGFVTIFRERILLLNISYEFSISPRYVWISFHIPLN